jgi:hypothetical protein
MSGKKIATVVVAGLLIAGIGGVAGYKIAGQFDTAPVNTTPSEPTSEQGKPAPTEPGAPQEPAKTPEDTKTQEPSQTPPSTPSAPSSDVISVRAYQGSGSMPLTDKGLKNSAFDIERLDWSEANRTLHVIGKMRVFEAVGYMRMRDENKEIVEPERVIRAAEGAPAWSSFEAQVSLMPEYKGKTLLVEFYEKSAKDGSRVHMLTFKIKPE